MPSPRQLLSDWDTQFHLLFRIIQFYCLHFIDEEAKPGLIVRPSGTNPLLLTIRNVYSYIQSDMYHV